MGDQEGRLPLSTMRRYVSVNMKKGLTQGSRSQTHHESITERSREGPVASVTKTRSHTLLPSVVAVQSPSRKIRVISAGCRSAGNGEREKV